MSVRISTTAFANGRIDAERRVADATRNGTLDMSALEASWARSLSRVSRAEGAIIPAVSVWQEGSADHIARAFASVAADILGVTFADVDSPEKILRYVEVRQSARESYSQRTSRYLGTSQDERKTEVLARAPKSEQTQENVKESPFNKFKVVADTGDTDTDA